MKVILLIWISAVFVREVVPGAIMRHTRDLGPESETSERYPRDLSNPLHSSVHTEYEATYQQKSQKGNESFSTVKGKQEIVHDKCSDNWNEFAEKCAALIKDLVASLANAISSNPGDTTNLQLQIKNSFRHFDSTHNCSCFNGSEANIKKIGLDLPLIFNRTSQQGTHGGSDHGSNGQTSCSGSSCMKEKTGSSPQVGSSGSLPQTNVLEPNEGQQDPGHVSSLSGRGPSEGTSESPVVGQPERVSPSVKGTKPNLPPYFLPLDYGKEEANPVADNHQFPTTAQGESGSQPVITGRGHPSQEGEEIQPFGKQPTDSSTTELSKGEPTPFSGHGRPEVSLQPVAVEPVIEEEAQGKESDCDGSGGSESSASHATAQPKIIGEPIKTDSRSGQETEEPMTVGMIPTNTHLGEEGGISSGTNEGTNMPEDWGMNPTGNEQVQVPVVGGGSKIPMTPSDSLIVEPVSKESHEGCENSENSPETFPSVPEVNFVPIAENPEQDTTGPAATIPAGIAGHPANTQGSPNTPEREQVSVGVPKMPAGEQSKTSQLSFPPPAAAHSVDPVVGHGNPLELPEGHKPELPTAHEPPHVLIKPPTTDPSATSGGFQTTSDSINDETSGTLGGDSAEPLFHGAATHQHDTPEIPTVGFSDDSLPPKPSQGHDTPEIPTVQVATVPQEVASSGANPSTNNRQGGHGMTTPQIPTTFQTTSVEPTQPDSLVLPTATTPTVSPHPTTLLLNQPDKSITSGSSLLPTDLPAHSNNHHHGLEEDYDDDDDDDDCCSCEACEGDIPNPRDFRKATCKDLQQAKRELKAIFDKIQKRLNCGRRTSKAITTSPL